MESKLPAGLALHCEACGIVVPADAPRPAAFDCDFVARHKLAWFNPKETIRRQHTMATAAWELIHHRSLREDAEAAAYWQAFRGDAKKHFRASAAYKALKPEDIEHQLGLKGRYDCNFYAD